MKTRIIVAAVLIPLLLAILFFLPLWCFAIVAAVLAGVGAYEFMRCTASAAPKYLTVAAIIFAASAPVSAWLSAGTRNIGISLFLFIVVLFVMMIVSIERNRKKISLLQMLCAFFAGVVFPHMFSALIRLGYAQQGAFAGFVWEIIRPIGLAYILLPIIITFTCDSGAYFAGVFLGKHKLAPIVSPKKTIEGSIGGFAAGIGFALLYGFVLSKIGFDVNFMVLAIYGFVGSVFCQIGDLSYSVIKREFGIKDYGSLFPGHGGALDKLDSMSFVAPVIELMLLIYPAISLTGVL